MLFLGIILAVFLGWNLDSLPYYFLFIQNYIPSQTVIGTHQDWTGHLPGINTMWSLAVEEHFYFVAPFLILKLRGVGLPITLFFYR
jgi:peptidoglycan/LPS O-acetylase OafA/YrhL